MSIFNQPRESGVAVAIEAALPWALGGACCLLVLLVLFAFVREQGRCHERGGVFAREIAGYRCTVPK